MMNRKDWMFHIINVNPIPIVFIHWNQVLTYSVWLRIKYRCNRETKHRGGYFIYVLDCHITNKVKNSALISLPESVWISATLWVIIVYMIRGNVCDHFHLDIVFIFWSILKDTMLHSIKLTIQSVTKLICLFS